jgi:hypothetical protein
MKAVLQKEQEEPVQEFIVLNEYCQVFCGFSKGYPAFSDDMEVLEIYKTTLNSKMYNTEHLLN